MVWKECQSLGERIAHSEAYAELATRDRPALTYVSSPYLVRLKLNRYIPEQRNTNTQRLEPECQWYSECLQGKEKARCPDIVQYSRRELVDFAGARKPVRRQLGVHGRCRFVGEHYVNMAGLWMVLRVTAVLWRGEGEPKVDWCENNRLDIETAGKVGRELSARQKLRLLLGPVGLRDASESDSRLSSSQHRFNTSTTSTYFEKHSHFL